MREWVATGSIAFKSTTPATPIIQIHPLTCSRLIQASFCDVAGSGKHARIV